MKQFSRALTALLTLLLLSSLCLVGVSAADEVVFQAGSVTAKVGDTVNIPITIIPTEDGVAALDVAVSFNNEMLEYVGTENEYSDSMAVNKMFEDTAKISLATLNVIQKETVLVELQFKVLNTAAKECTIRVDVLQASSYELKKQKTSTQNGIIPVTDTTATASDRVGDPDFEPRDTTVKATRSNVAGVTSGSTSSAQAGEEKNTSTAILICVIIAVIVVVIVLVIVLRGRAKERAQEHIPVTNDIIPKDDVPRKKRAEREPQLPIQQPEEPKAGQNAQPEAQEPEKEEERPQDTDSNEL